MITGKSAIEVSLLNYLDAGEYAVATGEAPDFSRYIVNGGDLFHFDAEDENLHLVHLDDVPRPEPAPGQEVLGAAAGAGQVEGAGLLGASTGNAVTTDPSGQTEEKPAEIVHKVVIDGKLSVQDFFSIYPCFIEPFVNNDVSIELTVKAYSTKENPILKNEQRMKSLREAVRQLGAKLREE
jgi:hypothetical protein